MEDKVASLGMPESPPSGPQERAARVGSAFVEQSAPRLVPDVEERFVRSLDAWRRAALENACALFEIERCGHFVAAGCASIGEYGERFGMSATEARQMTQIGKALVARPEIAERVLAGNIPISSAACLGEVYTDATLRRDGDDWLSWAESDSTKQLRRRIDRRREEARMGGSPAVGITLYVSWPARDAFARARTIASRRAERMVTEGETFETVIDHYLDTFDPDRRRAGMRRSPPTSLVPGRYVPASVQRELRARNGDQCAVPYCGHGVFLQNAHIQAYDAGGDQEADNLLRLCTRHHRLLDGGRIRVEGPADAPLFFDAKGRPLHRRRAGKSPPASGTAPPPAT